MRNRLKFKLLHNSVRASADPGMTVSKSRTAGAPAIPPASFEDALRELEAIVERMEDGTLGLEESLTAYKRGAELVKYCQAALEAVREQVQALDGEVLKPATDILSGRTEED